MNKKLIKICEKLGWTVGSCSDDGYVALAKPSPAGEDFSFSVGILTFVSDVERYATDFDVDAHAEQWIPTRGKYGAPSSIRKLVQDAEAIAKMLQELAAALQNETKKGEKS